MWKYYTICSTKTNDDSEYCNLNPVLHGLYNSRKLNLKIQHGVYCTFILIFKNPTFPKICLRPITESLIRNLGPVIYKKLIWYNMKVFGRFGKISRFSSTFD